MDFFYKIAVSHPNFKKGVPMKVLKHLFIAVGLINLTACGDSAEDAIRSALGNPQQNVKPQGLDGEWTSGCIDGAFGPDYGRRIISLKFSDSTFELKTDDYYGTDCTQLLETKTQRGTFSSIKSYSDDTFLIEYRIPINPQVSSLLNQKIQKKDNMLLVSEISTDEKTLETAPLSISMKMLEE
jgi:hypothetical protein